MSRKNLSATMTAPIRQQFLTLGLNYNTAPIAKRSVFALSPDGLTFLLKKIKAIGLAQDAVALITCNRAELYLGNVPAITAIRWLAQELEFSITSYKEYGYALTNQESVRHLLRVASGLDSMVLGEAEVLGQIKSAYKLAGSLGLCQGPLARLFEHSFAIAKRVRKDTSLGVQAISVAYIAVSLVKRLFARLSSTNVLVVGAGDTARLCVTHLIGAGVQKIIIANRDITKAKQLAAKIKPNFPFQFISIAAIPKYIKYVDIVVTMTKSSLPIIGKGMIETAMRARKRRLMVLLDLAVPRDIEAEVANLADVYLYNIDDLQSVAKKHQADRLQAAFVAEELVKEHALSFYNWHTANSEIELLKQLRKSYTSVQKKCVMQACARLKAGHDASDVLERLGHELAQKFLHQPSVELRRAVLAGDRDLATIIKQTFAVVDKL